MNQPSRINSLTDQAPKRAWFFKFRPMQVNGQCTGSIMISCIILELASLAFLVAAHWFIRKQTKLTQKIISKYLEPEPVLNKFGLTRE